MTGATVTGWDRGSSLVDVYHSGDANRPKAPFLFQPIGTAHLAFHPEGSKGTWIYWKTLPLMRIAAQPHRADLGIRRDGYFVQ